MTTCHPGTSWWTALPPLPLRGMGTPMVESLGGYAYRLAKISGISIAKLSAYRGTHSGRKYDANCIGKSLGPGANWIDDLEYLTGLNDLHCGTLWVLKDVIGQSFLGTKPQWRRWCPQCYREWAEEDRYEPLAWNFSLLVSCPVHHCLLESRCPNCGRRQYAVANSTRTASFS